VAAEEDALEPGAAQLLRMPPQVHAVTLPPRADVQALLPAADVRAEEQQDRPSRLRMPPKLGQRIRLRTLKRPIACLPAFLRL